MKNLLTILILIICLACVKEKNKRIIYTDQDLQLYNDVFTHLIRYDTYHSVLNDNEVWPLIQKYLHNDKVIDTATYNREIEKMFVEIEFDTSKQKSIALNVKFLMENKESFDFLLTDTSKFNLDFKNLVSTFSNNAQIIFDTIGLPQVKYNYKDFYSPYCKIGPSAKYIGGDIGFSFSKIYYNKKHSKAILYYDFYCGGKCGKGEFLFLINTFEGWKITSRYMAWIS